VRLSVYHCQFERRWNAPFRNRSSARGKGPSCPEVATILPLDLCDVLSVDVVGFSASNSKLSPAFTFSRNAGSAARNTPQKFQSRFFAVAWTNILAAFDAAAMIVQALPTAMLRGQSREAGARGARSITNQSF